MSPERASIIFGGVSSEHDASVKSFGCVYDRLRAMERPQVEIDRVFYVTTEGRVITSQARFDEPAEFYSRTPGNDAESLVECFARLAGTAEFLFSLLFGQYGEDGRVSALAEQSGVRGSFENFLAAGLAMSKLQMNGCVEGLGLPVRVPRTLIIRSQRDADAAFAEMQGATVIVKPNALGASLFTKRLILSGDARQAFGDLLERIFEFDRVALVQEYIEGVEYSCGCLRRVDEVTVLPVIRIVPRRGAFYGHQEKHDASAGVQEEFLKSAHPMDARIRQVSRALFRSTGFEQMCRFDYVADGDGNLWFLEGNSLPGLMPRSLYTHMLHEAGLDFDDLILQTIENERSRRPLRTTYRYPID